MPATGSQVLICDLPVRFDTYEGCSHACRYCFANRKRNIAQIKRGEGVDALARFIKGERTNDLRWCDWDIPLHFGGMSDPFQPVELKEKRTLAALQLFAETQYPFVVSTKNKLIAIDPYLSLIKQCNVVVQISAACKEYDQIERGASTFEERLEAMRHISPFKRVIVRIQPYLPETKMNVLRSLRLFADAGVYGVTIEGMKYIKAKQGTIRLNGDNVYPARILRRDYEDIKAEAHRLGMRFFCAENRLRDLGDDLCCCGIEGLGWRTNTGNLIHLLHDKEGVRFSDAQKVGGGAIFNLLHNMKQKSIISEYGKRFSFQDLVLDAYKTKNEMKAIIPEDTGYGK